MKSKKRIFLALWLCLAAAFLIASLLTMPVGAGEESIQETMRDAVLHDVNRIDFFGLSVNPGYVSSLAVTFVLLAAAVLIRLFAIPRFKYVPGRFQLLLEQIVGLFDGIAKGNSPWRNGFLGAYVFAAGIYIFSSTLFELFGFQVVAESGNSVALPAPLSDINAAVMLGVLSYFVIVSGAIAGNGVRGIGKALTEVSLLISMSFRLFGALLSGMLVTELVYHYAALSFGVPVIVGVLFTLLHALIQSYVLTMLTALFYGEMSEPAAAKAGRGDKARIAGQSGQTGHIN